MWRQRWEHYQGEMFKLWAIFVCSAFGGHFWINVCFGWLCFLLDSLTAIRRTSYIQHGGLSACVSIWRSVAWTSSSARSKHNVLQFLILSSGSNFQLVLFSILNIDGQARLVCLVHLQKDNGRLFLRQQTCKHKLPFAWWANNKRIKENPLGFCFPFWCLHLFLSQCLHVYVSTFPEFQKQNCGQCQLLFFSANGKRKWETSICCCKRKRKTDVCFLRLANDKR